MIDVFDRDEAGFRNWRDGHQRGGYVINTERSLGDVEGTRIHKAACPTLRDGAGGGEQLTESYMKVCSTNPRELDEWSQDHLGRGLRKLRCKHCNPSELGLTP